MFIMFRQFGVDLVKLYSLSYFTLEVAAKGDIYVDDYIGNGFGPGPGTLGILA